MSKEQTTIRPFEVFEVTLGPRSAESARQEPFKTRTFAEDLAELEREYSHPHGWVMLNAKQVKPRAKEMDRLEAINYLRSFVKPGMTLYTVLRHVSSSGMSRVIDVYSFSCENGKIEKWWLSGYTARALGERLNNRPEGVRVGGCGMDMGFHLVYSLSRTLFPHGFECIGKGCPSNDHSNYRDKDAPKFHTDGGYAITQAWI